jgi:twitching motility protein PilT
VDPRSNVGSLALAATSRPLPGGDNLSHCEASRTVAIPDPAPSARIASNLMPASSLSSELRRSLLRKILSNPAPGREELSSAIELTATKVVEQLQCQAMTLYLVEGEQIAFRQVYYSPTLWGADKTAEFRFKQAALKLLQLKLPKGTGNVGKVIETGQPLFFSSDGPDAATLKKMSTTFEVHSMLTVPLKTNIVLGAIQLLNKESLAGTNGQFEEKDLALLEEVADYSAALIHRMLDPKSQLSAEDSARFISKFSDLPLVTRIEDLQIDEKLVGAIGGTIIRREGVFPEKRTSDTTVSVIMANPLDHAKREAFERAASLTIDEIKVAPATLIEQLLKKYTKSAARISLGRITTKPETCWLVRLGIDNGLFSRSQCESVLRVLGPRAELLDFAQLLVDGGVVTDVEALEKLADLAMRNGSSGPPPNDPLAGPSPEAAGDAPGGETAESDASAVPGFPFDSIGAIGDDVLAAKLAELLKSTGAFGASDLHLSAGARPFIRKDRAFVTISEHALTAVEALRLNSVLLTEPQRRVFLDSKDFDYALAFDLTNRYRVNLMFHKQGAAGAYRLVPAKVRSLSELGFAAHIETINKLLSYDNGLILVTGPVGAGKTTTLASMVAFLNETCEDHIITVEDPIEVVQTARGCNVSQREVGRHTRSFSTALKGALREDPDVIAIGELRDLETIEMAITASETGHLVIGTMHTSDAATTLNRLLDVFPPAQQSQIRASVAESLRGIVCQRLLPASNGGLVLACEILVNNTAISNLIREGKSAGLRNTMETGVRDGMCLMDNVVFSLWEKNQITAPVALANIANRVLRARIS